MGATNPADAADGTIRGILLGRLKPIRFMDRIAQKTQQLKSPISLLDVKIGVEYFYLINYISNKIKKAG